MVSAVADAVSEVLFGTPKDEDGPSRNTRIAIVTSDILSESDNAALVSLCEAYGTDEGNKIFSLIQDDPHVFLGDSRPLVSKYSGEV